ncbi:MAG: hypothetical protein CVV49_17230 [Spirochaetae bacterium HGW-Spirochaetae-5]|nr:MAG: hypothetical protein CVV49_17230 [Spirochaetae bacterium HGW-Spirochaetae-5]
MNCNQCGACCIAPSISSIIPETGRNKPAGTRCVHLSTEMKCSIYTKRPAVCRDFTPTVDLCGKDFDEAFANLQKLEILTSC